MYATRGILLWIYSENGNMALNSLTGFPVQRYISSGYLLGELKILITLILISFQLYTEKSSLKYFGYRHGIAILTLNIKVFACIMTIF